jgi:hypothetical protein
VLLDGAIAGRVLLSNFLMRAKCDCKCRWLGSFLGDRLSRKKTFRVGVAGHMVS